ncbi:choice-of-anchor tandem repeat GloVer-containing protein [Methylotetracoccus oryzae]|uniref:choice-of-anchor tandem repeat GloVer-containing protein n=1 Tax=Methylotetracoccus oryzae TaxID=1919059 RepID=UPI0013A5A914|nr:choice-of-anchor tandem repeat GloVer-containing protein [Methylotetracoccus oryzae]
MWRTALRHRVTFGLGLALAVSAMANAATLTDLHDFDFSNDGGSPWFTGQLAQGRDGSLYGTTPSGGSYDAGTAFKLTPAGTFTKLHDFDSTNDGKNPWGGLILGKDGNFYGTTAYGGVNNFGTVFKMTPAGAITILHTYTGLDGQATPAPPTQGRDGNLYGTTAYGGTDSLGSVYKLTPGGNYTTIFSFPRYTAQGNYPQGALPYAPLIQGTDGAFYGTTTAGGSGGAGTGTVFKVTTAGVVSTVYNFDIAHGRRPYSPVVQGTDGNLYGTTTEGGTAGRGVAFKLTLKGAITVLYNFDGTSTASRANGYTPYAGLVQGSDGNFYGTTYSGGIRNSGTLFRITPAGDFAIQASFNGTNGAHSQGTPLLHTNGRIYGLSQSGGTFSVGTVYSLDVGAPGFIAPIPNAAKAGTSVGLLGAVGGTTGVSFNGVNASFSGTGNTFRTTVVPAGAATGLIKVTTPTGTPQTLKAFQQLPTLTAFGPASGAVGSAVILTGSGLTQTTKVTFGGGKIASFVVNSAEQITATVPAGATTAKIAVTTKGGSVNSAMAFNVTP